MNGNNDKAEALLAAVASLECSYVFARDFPARDVRTVLDALAATGKQRVGEEVSVDEDVYSSIADMIEPYVQREGTNPDGPLPASVHDSVQIIFDHWLKTRAQAVPSGMVLVQIADARRLCQIGKSFGQHFDQLPVMRVSALVDKAEQP